MGFNGSELHLFSQYLLDFIVTHEEIFFIQLFAAHPECHFGVGFAGVTRLAGRDHVVEGVTATA